jgi:hypothetical protein
MFFAAVEVFECAAIDLFDHERRALTRTDEETWHGHGIEKRLMINLHNNSHKQ